MAEPLSPARALLLDQLDKRVAQLERSTDGRFKALTVLVESLQRRADDADRFMSRQAADLAWLRGELAALGGKVVTRTEPMSNAREG